MRKLLAVLSAVFMITAGTTKIASADVICDDYGCYDDGGMMDVGSAKDAALN